MTMEITQTLIDEFVGVAHGNLARVKELLEAHPGLLNTNASFNETALGAAAQTGNIPIAEYLLAAGAPLDIFAAAMLGRLDDARAMLDASPALAGATGSHNLPLMWFPVAHNRADVADLLVARGADVNAGEGHSTALHAAAIFGQAAMAEWLIARGAHVNAPNYEGKTPLQLAVKNNRAAVADLLRRHGGVE